MKLKPLKGELWITDRWKATGLIERLRIGLYPYQRRAGLNDFGDASVFKSLQIPIRNAMSAMIENE